MKNGSIVAVKKLNLPYAARQAAQWLPIDDEKTPYVLRDGEMCDGMMVWRFEEGVIGFNPYTKEEFGIGQEYLIELLSPEQQVNVEELINVKELCI